MQDSTTYVNYPMQHIGYIMNVNEQIFKELDYALGKYPKHPSLEHSFAVIMEEFEELKAEVFSSRGTRDLEKVRKEAIQVAAMAVRLIFEMDVRREEADGQTCIDDCQ